MPVQPPILLATVVYLNSTQLCCGGSGWGGEGWDGMGEARVGVGGGDTIITEWPLSPLSYRHIISLSKYLLCCSHIFKGTMLFFH